MSSPIWLQVQHEVGNPGTGVLLVDLLALVSSFDIPQQEKSTILNVRGSWHLSGTRTAAGVGNMEFYCGLFAGHRNLDSADVQSMDINTSQTMGWMWRSYASGYVIGDGTNPVNLFQYTELLDVRSKRKLVRGNTLWSVLQGINAPGATSKSQLMLSILVGESA